jgi:hypothetical protein
MLEKNSVVGHEHFPPNSIQLIYHDYHTVQCYKDYALKMSVNNPATNLMVLKVLNMLAILTVKATWLCDFDKENVCYLQGRIDRKTDGHAMSSISLSYWKIFAISL